MATAQELKETVTVERETRTADGSGGFNITWATVYTMKARLEDLGGNEVIIADRLDSQLRYRLTYRHADAADLNVNDRINWDGTLLQIRTIPKKQRTSNFVTITVESGVAQ